MSKIQIRKRVLSRNDQLAASLRERFRKDKLLVLNLMSSPGSGKTTLLERTAEQLAGSIRIGVIEGDLQTDRDAERVRAHGIRAVQVNTDGGCHLDAEMVVDALAEFDENTLDVLIVENVGNLVCPAAFDLGEDATVLMSSVTEGDDKPVKYPTAFLKADVLVLNKIDLVPYTNFSVERFCEDVALVKESLPVLKLSCRTGEGLETWIQWLQDRVAMKRG